MRSPLASCARRSRDTAPRAVYWIKRSNWSRRWAGTWVLACKEKPCTLAQRGPVSLGASPSAPKPEPMRPDLLSSPLAKGEALRHRGGHGSGQLGSVVTQGVIACRHSGIEARFQVPQLAELAHDPMADLRDDRGNIGIGGRLACDKAWHEVRLSAIEVDALKEDAREMEVHIDGTAKALDKGHRPWLHLIPWDSACDCLGHIILSDRGANDRMDLRRQLLGRGHPIPQGEGAPLNRRPSADAVVGDRHRHDPLAGGAPGHDLLDEVGGGLGHAPPRTGRTKPPPRAAAGRQQLPVAGVTAQPEDTMREDAARPIVLEYALPTGGDALRVGISVE